MEIREAKNCAQLVRLILFFSLPLDNVPQRVVHSIDPAEAINVDNNQCQQRAVTSITGRTVVSRLAEPEKLFDAREACLLFDACLRDQYQR
ncbi:hypothetical protein T03_17869 [Trichinella britovi]|uniref:Uncharacterized protein n=1 Tax=Trichinella britovi TaxID=45882 RepID=A0A0V1C9Y8_TRIBR|nr:hypothetical protein T03_17869 [Trichinella britovi]